MASKTWTIQVSIDEEDDDTRADATLQLGNKMEMRG
ncbi:MAG: dsRBD fold-containing protein, partial [Nocardioides sp.]